MRITEAIKHVCEKGGKGVVGTSQALGKSRMYLSALISRGSYPRTDTLVQIANVKRGLTPTCWENTLTHFTTESQVRPQIAHHFAPKEIAPSGILLDSILYCQGSPRGMETKDGRPNMTNDTKWEELRQAEEMAYFKADVCLYSPESYSLEEKKEICNEMMASSKAMLDAMREDFQSYPPEFRAKLLDMLCQSGVESADWWWDVLVGDGDPLYHELEPLS